MQSNSSDKRIATKAVTDTFPSAKYSKRKLVYLNVSKLVSFTQSERGITVLEENSNVSKLKEKLKLSSELISSWQNDIRQLYDQQPLEVHQLRVTCLMYDNEVEKYMNLHAELDKLYKNEIECLMMKTHGQYLPQSVRDQFNDEFSFLCQRVNLALRDPEKQIEFLLADQNLDSLRSDFEIKRNAHSCGM